MLETHLVKKLFDIPAPPTDQHRERMQWQDDDATIGHSGVRWVPSSMFGVFFDRGGGFHITSWRGSTRRIKHQRSGEYRRQTADGMGDVRGKLPVTAWKERRTPAGCRFAQHCNYDGTRDGNEVRQMMQQGRGVA